MAKDRTAEFVSTIKLMQGKPNWVNNSELRSRKAKLGENLNGNLANHHVKYKTLMRGSRSVARDIYLTYQKLEKLNHLAKKRTIFDGEQASREINELVYIIRQDITSLNQQIETLRQNQMQCVEYPNSSSKNTKNIESHSKNVVLTLQQQLASMSNNFKTTLEVRSQNLQQQKARRQQFVSPVTNGTSSGSTIIDFDNVNSGNSSENIVKSPSQQQLLIYQDQGTEYAEERASAMQSIESTIVELGAIFNQLATMVQQQEEMITRIDSNVTDTQMNVEAAHESLLRYFQSVNNNRWLILKVFGVLFFFFVIFVLFA